MGDFAPDLKALPREAGRYRVRRGKGDHEIWFSPATERNFVVDPPRQAKAFAEFRYTTTASPGPQRFR